MKHLDLFSGIGGFSLAADWVWGKGNVEHIFCEIEEFPQKVLMKHWPGSELYHDITKLDGTAIADVHLLTGGFPCQPYSVAGKQLGAEDDRALWPEMLRVISETKPRWIIGENVGGFVSMGLDNCISDLEGIGYDCQPLVIPACAVNAPHRRDRVWIVADNVSNTVREQPGGINGPCRESSVFAELNGKTQSLADTNTEGLQGRQEVGDAKSGRAGREKQPAGCRERSKPGNGLIEPDVGRVAHGIPSRVDRLKGLGNAIVPQVAAVIMQAIKDIDNPSPQRKN
jgi:DNA (cytosine-5)-methyltransferase 1